jgi:UDP-N-acetylmuramate dehydrogenase
VISLARLTGIERLADNRVRVEAGVTYRQLTRFLLAEGLTGLEFLCGIPGTVGGALAMNAGAHGGAIFDRVERLTTWHAGSCVERLRAQLTYGYRFCALAADEVIVSTVLALAAAEPAISSALVAEYELHRTTSQRVGYPSAGSFFKNPAGAQAWRLIDQAGLRGKRINGAQVSEVHCNFLVNRGGATASDFLALATVVKEQVLEKTGFLLAEEVRIVGEDVLHDA